MLQVPLGGLLEVIASSLVLAVKIGCLVTAFLLLESPGIQLLFSGFRHRYSWLIQIDRCCHSGFVIHKVFILQLLCVLWCESPHQQIVQLCWTHPGLLKLLFKVLSWVCCSLTWLCPVENWHQVLGTMYQPDQYTWGLVELVENPLIKLFWQKMV